MSISWEQWDAMCGSLNYSWQRMGELVEPRTAEGEAEYEALIGHAMETANRIVGLSLADTPPLSNAALRERWQEARGVAMEIRERIALARSAVEARDSLDEDESLAEHE